MTVRQSTYTQEIADEICRRISEGESLRHVCRDESMPCTSTVLKWARDIEGFSQQYAKAREMLLEHWAEEIVEISDDTSRDTIEKKGEDGETYAEVANSEWISRSRLRVDTRKWLLSKLAAKKYGERMALTDPDGGPLQVKIVQYSQDT